jgi:hypothetical protein
MPKALARLIINAVSLFEKYKNCHSKPKAGSFNALGF